MKDFGRWFAEFRLPELWLLELAQPVAELPEGIDERDGEYVAYCCVCDEPGPLYCGISEIPMTGYRHHCGRSPSCCP